MYSVNCYNKLSEEDPRKFCESLAGWCPVANAQKAIMLFDVQSLQKVILNSRRKSSLQGIVIETLPNALRRVLIHDLELTWGAYGEKAILQQIVDKSKNIVLYQAPETFGESILWYAF